MYPSNIDEICAEFVRLIRGRWNAVSAGDADLANRLFELVNRLFDQIYNAGIHIEVYENLIALHIPAVNGKMSALMLTTGYAPAEAVLEDLAKTDTTLVSVDAMLFLSQWRDGLIPRR